MAELTVSAINNLKTMGRGHAVHELQDSFTVKTGASLYMAGSKLGNCRC